MASGDGSSDGDTYGGDGFSDPPSGENARRFKIFGGIFLVLLLTEICTPSTGGWFPFAVFLWLAMGVCIGFAAFFALRKGP